MKESSPYSLLRESFIGRLMPGVLQAIHANDDLPLEPESEHREAIPDTFQDIVDMQGDIRRGTIIIPRSPSVREKYRQVRQKRKETGFSFQEYIDQLANGRPFFIHENEFPYFVDKENAAKHYLVWILKPLPRPVVARGIAEFLCDRGYGEDEYVLIKNPIFEQTVPEIEHFHLFTRQR